MSMHATVLATPIGGLGVSVLDGALVGISFGADGEPDAGTDIGLADIGLADIGRTEADTTDDRIDPVLGAVIAELTEYFAGERLDFTVPLQIVRGSAFERAVWAEIAAIPYGETLTYGAIARAVGEPGGAQAVGLACNRNPLPVVIACHRVVGAGGKLVGFGGGLPRKRFLLQLEAKTATERGILLNG